MHVLFDASNKEIVITMVGKKIKIFQTPISKMKIKVFEIVKRGLAPLSQEIEDIVQEWLDDNKGLEIVSTSQSQHLRENTVFITIFYNITDT